MDTKLKLKKYELVNDSDSNIKEISIFEISHNNLKTTVSQDITLRKDVYGKYSCSVNLEDIVDRDTAMDALLKQAEWFERLSIALKEQLKLKDSLSLII